MSRYVVARPASRCRCRGESRRCERLSRRSSRSSAAACARLRVYCSLSCTPSRSAAARKRQGSRPGCLRARFHRPREPSSVLVLPLTQRLACALHQHQLYSLRPVDLAPAARCHHLDSTHPASSSSPTGSIPSASLSSSPSCVLIHALDRSVEPVQPPAQQLTPRPTIPAAQPSPTACHPQLVALTPLASGRPPTRLAADYTSSSPRCVPLSPTVRDAEGTRA